MRWTLIALIAIVGCGEPAPRSPRIQHTKECKQEFSYYHRLWTGKNYLNWPVYEYKCQHTIKRRPHENNRGNEANQGLTN